LRIALVGCGHIAKYHAQAVSKAVNPELLAFCDIDTRRAEMMASSWKGARWYADVDEMLNEVRPEVVHILTPPQSHAPLSIKAIEAGAHVLVEKPMCLTSEEADLMIRASDRSRRLICVDHSLLFDPLFARARTLIDKGVIGPVFHVESYASPNTEDYRSEKPNHWVWGLPAGVITDVLPHALYLITALLPDSSLRASTLRGHYNGVDGEHCHLHASFESGDRTGSMTVVVGATPTAYRLSIYGIKGHIEIDFSSRILLVHKERFHGPFGRGARMLELSANVAGTASLNAINLLTRRLPLYSGTMNLVSAFYSSLKRAHTPPVSLNDAKRVVDLSSLILSTVKGSREG
jgi:predicted dehydrogenase